MCRKFTKRSARKTHPFWAGWRVQGTTAQWGSIAPISTTQVVLGTIGEGGWAGQHGLRGTFLGKKKKEDPRSAYESRKGGKLKRPKSPSPSQPG